MVEITLDQYDGVTMPTKEKQKRGPKPNSKFAELDQRAFADISNHIYASTLDAAKAYLYEYYPNCSDEQRNDKIRYIICRLDLIKVIAPPAAGF